MKDIRPQGLRGNRQWGHLSSECPEIGYPVFFNCSVAFGVHAGSQENRTAMNVDFFLSVGLTKPVCRQDGAHSKF